jgi:hypothetical protein
MPQVMAAVWHTGIGLMRWAGQTHMAVAVSPLCGPARVSLEAYRYDTGKLHGLSLVISFALFPHVGDTTSGEASRQYQLC